MSDYYGAQSLGLGIVRGADGKLILGEKQYGANSYQQDFNAKDFAGPNNKQWFGGGSLRPVAATGLPNFVAPSRTN